jgi:hypothetical protein
MIKKLKLVIFILIASVSSANASEFRSIRPIIQVSQMASKSASSQLAKIGNLGEKAEEAKRDAANKVKEAVNEMVKDWNSGNIEKWLDGKFYNRTRFLDALQISDNKDAKLRLLAVESARVVDQKFELSGSELNFQTKVAVELLTQVEFSDPAKGFRRIEGRNEYIFCVRHHAGIKTSGEEQ